MKKNSFVCSGSKASVKAFIYSELPRKRSSEEFFAFFLPLNSSDRERMKGLFRKAISTSRMGTARNYFLKFLNEIRDDVEKGRELFNRSIILLMIKRGNRMHILYNRGASPVHWDGSKREEGPLSILAPIPLEGQGQQPDLFDSSAEELFSCCRIGGLSGNHTILFTPSAEFTARYREQFLNSVFFPSFRVPEAEEIKLETDYDIPGIHWNREVTEEEKKERFSDIMKNRRVSIPLLAGAVTTIVAIMILFNPFGKDKEAAVERNNLLYSAQENNGQGSGREQPGRSSTADINAREDSPENGGMEMAEQSISDSEDAGETASVDISLNKSWKKKFPEAVTSSPATDGMGIIFGSRDGFVYCISPEGEIKWKYNMNAGVGSSPVMISPGRVACADYQGDLVCLDTAVGKPVWSQPLKSRIVSTPAQHGKHLFVGTMTGELFCIDIDTGEKVWERKAGEKIWSSIRTGGDYVLVATTDGYLKKYDFSGRIVWSETPGREIYSTPLAIPEADLVLVGTEQGLISTFSLSECILRWQYSVGNKVRSTPAISGDYIVLGTDDGKIFCFNIEGRMRWMQDIGKAVRSEPLIRDGVVYITSYTSTMFAIKLTTGNIIAKYPTEASIYSSPLFHDGKIYFGNNAGFFHCAELVQN